jgi:hypothetical protein
MKRVHPIFKLTVAIAAISFLSSAAGCKNQQSAVAANPFLSPNRVPPPSTRALAPGQAQPYYQGDPLPVSQNGVAPPNAVAQASAEAAMPSADGLAWGSPGNAAAVPNAAPTPMSSPPTSSPPSPSVVASNEPTVAIPDDGSSLRFAPPTGVSAEPQAFTPSNPVALASTQQPPTNVPPTLPSPASSQGISQAAYTEPVITSSQAPAPSPWRSPQIAPASSAPNYNEPQTFAAQPMGQPLAANMPPSLPPYYSTPTIAAANTMEVQMREVPSPPMPRIRIPGYDTSVPTVGSADGFRPRTSMR